MTKYFFRHCKENFYDQTGNRHYVMVIDDSICTSVNRGKHIKYRE
jgi:hypothetical protein